MNYIIYASHKKELSWTDLLMLYSTHFPGAVSNQSFVRLTTALQATWVYTNKNLPNSLKSVTAVAHGINWFEHSFILLLVSSSHKFKVRFILFEFVLFVCLFTCLLLTFF